MSSLDRPETLQIQLVDLLSTVGDVLSRNEVPYFLAAGTALGAVRGGDLIPWDFDVDVLIPVTAYERACAVLGDQLPVRYSLSSPYASSSYEHLFGRVHLAAAHHKFVHVDLFPLVGTFQGRRLQHAHLAFSRMLRKLYFLGQRARLKDVPREPRLRAAAYVVRLIPRRLIRGAFWALARIRRLERSRSVTNLAAGYMTRECVPAQLFETPTDASIRGQRFPVPNPPEAYLESLYGDFDALPPVAERERQMAHFWSWYAPAISSIRLDTK